MLMDTCSATTQLWALSDIDPRIMASDVSDPQALLGWCKDTKQFRFVPPAERCVPYSLQMPLWVTCLRTNTTPNALRNTKMWLKGLRQASA